MKRLSIGVRIILSFLIVAVVFGIVGYIGIFNIGQINNNGDLLYNNNTVGIAYSGDAAISFEQLRFSLLQLCVIKNDNEKEKCYESIEKNINDVESYLNQYKQTIISEENLAIYNDLIEKFESYKKIVNTSMDFSKQGLSEYAKDLILVSSKDLSEAINSQFKEMFLLNKDNAQTVNRQNKDDGKTATQIMIIMVCAGVSIAVWLGILIGKHISRSVKRASDQLEKIAAGEDVKELDQKKFSGEFKKIANNLNGVRESLHSMQNDAFELVNAGIEGRLSTRADASKHMGYFKAIIEGFNKSLDAFIAPIEETIVVLKEVQQGNLNIRLTGEYCGDYINIKEALNDTINTVKGYIDEASFVLNKVAQGDLTVDINSRYRGDFILLKESINSIIKSLNSLLLDIYTASSEVAAGTQQVSSSSQIVSQGAVEQTRLIEELTETNNQIAQQTKQNAKDAVLTSEITIKVKDSALAGNKHMTILKNAMDEIDTSSKSIYSIIKVIDDIAFQTNILALNAAVEAARAGFYGKGFAVVASEVKGLADQSVKAANETKALIENSINKVKAGSVIVDQTSSALDKIVSNVESTVKLVSNITDASKQQATSMMQVNSGIDHFSQVIQSNSASSEETAAAAEEISSQAEVLKQMVMRFKLMDYEFDNVDTPDINETVLLELSDNESDINNYGKY